MTDSPDLFFQRLSQRVAVLLAIIMLPALLASALRAFNADGAYGVVIFQVLIFAWIVYLALPLSRTSFAVRTYSFVGISVAIAVGALIRNPDSGVGMASLIVASIFLSAITIGPVRYIFIAVVFPASAVISHFTGQLGWAVVISQALAMAGMAAVANMLVGGVVSHAKGRVQEELKLREERDEALAGLAKELARRDLVASAADIAHLEYDYATGMLNGDLALQRRFGRNADDGAIDLSSRFDDFPVESLALIQQEIAEMSHQPVGAEATFIHQQYTGEERAVSTFRVTGVNLEHDGRLLFMGASIDITDAVVARQQAQKQADQLKLVTEQGNIGLYEFDLENGVMYANSVLCERYGVDPDVGVITQQQLFDSLTEDSRVTARAQIEAGKTQPEGYFTTSTVEEVHSGGVLRKIRIFEKLERRDGRPFYVGASVDVTEEVQAKEQAQSAAMKLAQEQDRQA